MPWHIVPNHSECGTGRYAVVKDADGSVAGCHATKAEAQKQMAALYANEPGRSGAGRSEEVDMAAVERRYTKSVVEVRTAEDRRKIGGYAAVFNRYSDNLGGFIEQVAPSFFNKSRADGFPDVIARYNHDDNMLLGTTDSGTLSLRIDETGLLYEVDPPQSRQDILELVSRGDVRKSSFAFRVYPEGDEWTVNDLGNVVRTLISGQLVDVAPVNRPAYPDSSAGLRSAAGKAALAAADLVIALESLARRFDAEVEEVRALAAEDELRRFFVKTEAGKPVQKAKPRMFGPAAAAALLVRKQDPWG